MSSIDETVQACKRAGHGFPLGVVPVQSDLKRETSLVGMAYLNYTTRTTSPTSTSAKPCC